MNSAKGNKCVLCSSPMANSPPDDCDDQEKLLQVLRHLVNSCQDPNLKQCMGPERGLLSIQLCPVCKPMEEKVKEFYDGLDAIQEKVLSAVKRVNACVAANSIAIANMAMGYDEDGEELELEEEDFDVGPVLQGLLLLEPNNGPLVPEPGKRGDDE